MTAKNASPRKKTAKIKPLVESKFTATEVASILYKSTMLAISNLGVSVHAVPDTGGSGVNLNACKETLFLAVSVEAQAS